MSDSESIAEIERITGLVNQCLVPRFIEGNDRPCNESDFVHFKAAALESMRKLLLVLINRSKSKTGLYEKQIVASLILLFGENSQRFPWNSEESYETCRGIRTVLLDALGYPENTLLEEGISEGKGKELRPLLKPVLLALRPKLMKETWKENPAAVECFTWLLSLVRSNQLADHVHLVLPTALLLVDDFVNENRVIGIRCLSRIIDAMTLAELKYHGYGLVIYKALESLLRERDPSVASILIPCILNLTVKLETEFGDAEPTQKWSRFDDIMEILLEVIEVEHLIALRAVYISQMVDIIQTLGHRIQRWSKRVLSLLDHYLEVAGSLSDFTSMLHALKALCLFLQITQPVQKWYRPSVLLTLLRQLYIIYGVSLPNQTCSEVLELTASCLKLVLSGCTAVELQAILEDVKTEFSDHLVLGKVVGCLKNVSSLSS